MKIKLKSATLTIPEGSKDIGIVAFTRYNTCLALSSQLADDLTELFANIGKTYHMVPQDPEKAQTMLSNIQNSIFALTDNERLTTYQAKAFAAMLCNKDDLIKSDDLSDSYLESKIMDWEKEGLTNGQINEGLDFFRKASGF